MKHQVMKFMLQSCFDLHCSRITFLLEIMSHSSAHRLINDLCIACNNVGSDNSDCNQSNKDMNAPQQRQGTEFCHSKQTNNRPDNAQFDINGDNKQHHTNTIFVDDIWKYQSELYKSFDVCDNSIYHLLIQYVLSIFTGR